MIEQIEKLDKHGLRKFGLVTGSIVIVLFGLLLPLLFGFGYPLWPWYLGGILAAVALVVPVALNPVYHGWMRFGAVLGWINTRLILGIVFYVIFTPVALILKLIRHDPMKRKFEKDPGSYRKLSHNQSKEHMENPY